MRDGRVDVSHKKLSCITGRIVREEYNKYTPSFRRVYVVANEQVVPMVVYMKYIDEAELLTILHQPCYFQMFEYNNTWAIYDYIKITTQLTDLFTSSKPDKR